MFKSGNLSNLAHSQQPRRLRAVTLVRVSTAEQAAEGRSGIDRQRQSNLAAIKSHGFNLVKAIEIVDVSGTNSFSCPEMLDLISMIESQTVDVVVVAEISRIFRPDSLSSFGSLDVFKRNRVTLCCGGTIHDLDSPEGFLSSGIMSLLGGYERLSMLRKMLQSKESSRANGFCPSSAITLPLGLHYDRSVNKFSYGPEIWKIKEAFRLIDEDGLRNFSEIGRRVTVQHRSLRNLLSNKSYVGIREYLEMRDQTKKPVKPGGRQADRPKIKRKLEQQIRVRIIPPEQQAVSDERFERVQKVLAEIADRHAKFVAPHKGTNLLTSIGYCGCCGSILYTASTSRRAPDGTKARGYYLCKSSYYLFKGTMPTCSQGWLKRDRMDELVSAFAVRFLEDPEFLTAILNHAKIKQRETVISIGSVPESIRQQISEIEKRDRRLIDAIESGAISLPEVKQRRQRLEEEKRALLLTLSDVEVSGEASSLPGGMIGRIASMGVEAWTSLSCPRERKKLLTTLFMEIYVKGESITAFRLAPSLVGSGLAGSSLENDPGEWSWIFDVPVTMPEPFRISPVPEMLSIPDGHRQCSRCKVLLPATEFHGSRAGCKPCIRADNNARYAAKVAAKVAAKAAVRVS